MGLSPNLCNSDALIRAVILPRRLRIWLEQLGCLWAGKEQDVSTFGRQQIAHNKWHLCCAGSETARDVIKILSERIYCRKTTAHGVTHHWQWAAICSSSNLPEGNSRGACRFYTEIMEGLDCSCFNPSGHSGDATNFTDNPQVLLIVEWEKERK